MTVKCTALNGHHIPPLMCSEHHVRSYINNKKRKSLREESYKTVSTERDIVTWLLYQ